MILQLCILTEWMEYLINNVYIKVGNRVYCQTIGTPMGTDCAPQLANLFLFQYEYSDMKGLMRDNLCIVKRFSDTVRYIDDLLTLNNKSFEEEIINIYPPELTLKPPCVIILLHHYETLSCYLVVHIK